MVISFVPTIDDRMDRLVRNILLLKDTDFAAFIRVLKVLGVSDKDLSLLE